MANRPKDLSKEYGWCRKKGHGVILPSSDGCNRCRVENERKAEGKCCSVLHHGPGHQSRTYCELVGPHSIHQASYGCYDEFMQWRGREAYTGYFDDPKELPEKDQRKAEREAEEQACREFLDKKEGIAAIIFEPDGVDPEEYERPHEEDCHIIAEQILEFLNMK